MRTTRLSTVRTSADIHQMSALVGTGACTVRSSSEQMWTIKLSVSKRVDWKNYVTATLLAGGNHVHVK